MLAYNSSSRFPAPRHISLLNPATNEIFDLIMFVIFEITQRERPSKNRVA